MCVSGMPSGSPKGAFVGSKVAPPGGAAAALPGIDGALCDADTAGEIDRTSRAPFPWGVLR